MESLYDLVYQGFHVSISAHPDADPSRRIMAIASRILPPESYTATGATIAIAVSKITLNLPAR